MEDQALLRSSWPERSPPALGSGTWENHRLDWWQETKFEAIRLVATPAQHYSARSIGDRNKTLWSSWVLISEHMRIFFNGDSGYFDGYNKDIGEKYGPFDLCLVECGQNNEEWSGRHMIPIHWGMFKLSSHSWTAPVERVLKAAGENHSSVLTPRIGEIVLLDSVSPSLVRWWRESSYE